MGSFEVKYIFLDEQSWFSTCICVWKCFNAPALLGDFCDFNQSRTLVQMNRAARVIQIWNCSLFRLAAQIRTFEHMGPSPNPSDTGGRRTLETLGFGSDGKSRSGQEVRSHYLSLEVCAWGGAAWRNTY